VSIIWNSMTAVLIVACPCALALTLPFAHGHAMRQLGAIGLYLKNADVVETLSKIKTIVFDKTGTLTANDTKDVTFVGHPLHPDELIMIKSTLTNSAHPLSRLVMNSLPATEKRTVTDYREILGQGMSAVFEGRKVKIGSADWVKTPKEEVVNESRVHVSIDGELRGYFACGSTYRVGVFEMLNSLKDSYNLQLLSGDNDSERIQLAPYFSTLEFNQKPQDKRAFLAQITQPTLMVGDGLNDAGALQAADSGMAVSEDVHRFSPACDSIISSKSLTKLPSILRFSKSVRTVIILAMIISLLYNVVGLAFAMTGQLTPLVSAILMPVSSITVMGFVTLMVGWKGRVI